MLECLTLCVIKIAYIVKLMKVSDNLEDFLRICHVLVYVVEVR